MHKKNSERGTALLLDLLVCVLILEILACMALPNVLQMQASTNQAAARKRIALVSQAQSEIALCNLNNTCNASAVVPLVPAPGSITMGGYVYTFTQNGNAWTYAARPINAQLGVYGYFVSNDGVIRCDIQSATAASPVCY